MATILGLAAWAFAPKLESSEIAGLAWLPIQLPRRVMLRSRLWEIERMNLERLCIACGRPFLNPILADTGVLCRACSAQGLFRKKVVITGITRMGSGHICVSGIDPQTMRFVRPVFACGLDRDFAMDGSRQVVRHFNLIEIEFRQYRPSKLYHTEDWIINERFAPRFVRHLSDAEVTNIVQQTSVNDLNAALAPRNRSLFTVRAHRMLAMWHEHYESFKVRVSFVDHAGNRFDRLPVTDLLTLAFARYQLSVGNPNYAQQIVAAFNSNTHRYIRIGLTREWRGQHWKQITALITIPDLFNGNTFSYYESLIGEHA